MKFGDICLVNFDPSIGKEYKKVRPALVVQDESIAGKSPYVTVMPISSKVDRMSLVDVLLSKDEENKLLADSIVKVQQISSFDKRRIIKVFGEVKSPVRRKVKGYIRKHFGL